MDNHPDASSERLPPRRRRFMIVDRVSSAILDHAIAKHERSSEIFARLSRAQMLHYLLGRAVECACGGTGELPALDVSSPASGAPERRRIVEVYPAVLLLLDEQIRKEEQDVAVGVRFSRPQMLRRLLGRAARCTCARAGAAVAGESGLKPWQVPREQA